MLIPVVILSAYVTAKYTQYNTYAEGSCRGQPITMVSALGGQCLIQGTAASSCAEYTGAVFRSQNTICTQDPLDLKGIVQLYVARYSWVGSDSCSGDPSSVVADVGDAGCHPVSGFKGTVTEWTSVSCNGERPIYKSCSDSSCTKCTETQYSGNCEVQGAGASTKAICIWPMKKGVTAGGVGNDDSDSSAGVLGAGAMLALPFALLI